MPAVTWLHSSVPATRTARWRIMILPPGRLPSARTSRWCVSSVLKYCLATRCTSAGVTFCTCCGKVTYSVQSPSPTHSASSLAMAAVPSRLYASCGDVLLLDAWRLPPRSHPGSCTCSSSAQRAFSTFSCVVPGAMLAYRPCSDRSWRRSVKALALKAMPLSTSARYRRELLPLLSTASSTSSAGWSALRASGSLCAMSTEPISPGRFTVTRRSALCAGSSVYIAGMGCGECAKPP